MLTFAVKNNNDKFYHLTGRQETYDQYGLGGI